MPRYLLGARTTTRAERESVASLTDTRYPEVRVDLRYAAHDDDGLDVWVCRAPSETHVRRWAAAADLELRLVQLVDAENATEPTAET
jgi:hypothetical protein